MAHAGHPRRARHGRSGTCTRTSGNLTLAEAIRSSSNIAMAKFSLRLTPEQQYEMLRDFGFGTPTGAEFPSESRGRLESPDRWQPMYTRASMAMGYEFGVTPVQLAAAYGAIANDGLLMAPTLLREVRDPAGDGAVPAGARAGAAGDQPRDRGPAPRVSAGSGGRGRHRWRGAAGELHGAGKDRHRRALRGRTVRAGEVHRVSFAAIFPGRRSPAGGDREDRQPQGQVLRRTDRGARSPGRCCSRRSPPAGSPSTGAG